MWKLQQCELFTVVGNQEAKLNQREKCVNQDTEVHISMFAIRVVRAMTSCTCITYACVFSILNVWTYSKLQLRPTGPCLCYATYLLMHLCVQMLIIYCTTTTMGDIFTYAKCIFGKAWDMRMCASIANLWSGMRNTVFYTILQISVNALTMILHVCEIKKKLV